MAAFGAGAEKGLEALGEMFDAPGGEGMAGTGPGLHIGEAAQAAAGLGVDLEAGLMKISSELVK